MMNFKFWKNEITIISYVAEVSGMGESGLGGNQCLEQPEHTAKLLRGWWPRDAIINTLT